VTHRSGYEADGRARLATGAGWLADSSAAHLERGLHRNDGPGRAASTDRARTDEPQESRMRRGYFCMRRAKKCLAASGRAYTGAEASGTR